MSYTAIWPIFLLLFPSSTLGIRLDVNIYDKSGTKSRVKLMCELLADIPEANENQDVSGHGVKSGIPEDQYPDIFLPDINGNSSDRYRCFLLDSNTVIDGKQVKKRFHRELTESLPMEAGSCRPGYRIDQDRCFPCFPGSFTGGQETECTLCPKNFYISNKAADSCWPCPEGKVTLGEGSDSEDSCVDADSNGKPRPPAISTLWIIIIACILIVILVTWLIFLAWWFSRKRKLGDFIGTEDILENGELDSDGWGSDFDVDEDGYLAPIQPAKGNKYAKLVPSVDSQGYEIVDRNGSAEHIYEEIGNYNNVYEEPIKPGSKKVLKTTSEDLYETPIKKETSEHSYEEVKGGIYDYEEPIKPAGNKISKPTNEDLYETPITKQEAHNFYEPVKGSTNDQKPKKTSDLLPSEIPAYYEAGQKKGIQNNPQGPPEEPTTSAGNRFIHRSRKAETPSRRKPDTSDNPEKKRHIRRSSKPNARVQKSSDKPDHDGLAPRGNKDDAYIATMPDSVENWLSYTNRAGFKLSSDNFENNLGQFKYDHSSEMHLKSSKSGRLNDAKYLDFAELGCDWNEMTHAHMDKRVSKTAKVNILNDEIDEKELLQKSEPIRSLAKPQSTRRVKSDESDYVMIQL